MPLSNYHAILGGAAEAGELQIEYTAWVSLASQTPLSYCGWPVSYILSGRPTIVHVASTCVKV